MRNCKCCGRKTLKNSNMLIHIIGVPLKCSECGCIMKINSILYIPFGVLIILSMIALFVTLGNSYGIVGIIVAFSFPIVIHVFLPWWFPLDIEKPGSENKSKERLD